ncbi:hypothetical protein [Frankia sp. QA3]|uniref:hypothetical protein n=1 Tax=Frankia sp. QA3 TaxID=710111 RepID=UPI0012F721C3|nr:hypothetical protein [Frankia sp. QA3]
MSVRAGDQLVEVRLCGRPTRSGKPCRMRLYGPEIACRTHLTEHERDVAEAYQRGMGDGHRCGWENGQELGKQQVERLQRRIRELEGLLGRGTLRHETGGEQVVEVDG